MTEPTLAEIIRRGIEARLLDLHTALPGIVQSYDSTTNTVDVLPAVRRPIETKDAQITHEDLPIIPGVPVAFPQSAAFTATWPLAKGDGVLIVFCEAAIGNWQLQGTAVDAGDLRRHDLSHAVAIPGISPNTTSLPTSATAAVLEVNSPATTVNVGAGATEFVVLADKLVTAFNTHTHSGVTTGAGVTGTPAAPMVAATIAATKLKSE